MSNFPRHGIEKAEGDIRKVQITSTFIGFEAGVFTWGIVTIAGMRVPSEEIKKRGDIDEFHKECGFMTLARPLRKVGDLESVLKTIGVGHWGDLQGAYCRVKLVDEEVIGIGHIDDHRWFYPDSANPRGVGV